MDQARVGFPVHPQGKSIQQTAKSMKGKDIKVANDCDPPTRAGLDSQSEISHDAFREPKDLNTLKKSQGEMKRPSSSSEADIMSSVDEMSTECDFGKVVDGIAIDDLTGIRRCEQCSSSLVHGICPIDHAIARCEICEWQLEDIEAISNISNKCHG